MIIKLANGTQYKCTFCGYSSINGALYIDLPEMTMSEAILVFSDEEATKVIIYKDDNAQDQDAQMVRKGFVVLISVGIPDDAGDFDKTVRVILRRRYEGEGELQ